MGIKQMNVQIVINLFDEQLLLIIVQITVLIQMMKQQIMSPINRCRLFVSSHRFVLLLLKYFVDNAQIPLARPSLNTANRVKRLESFDEVNISTITDCYLET